MSHRGGGGPGRGKGRGSGRGEYYRQKYGEKGRGGKNNGGSSGDRVSNSQSMGGNYSDLQRLLEGIDGAQYPRYHDLETAPGRGWQNGSGFILSFGRTQADPFAPPTRVSVSVPSHLLKLQGEVFSTKEQCIATGDFLLRRLSHRCQSMGADKSLRNSGGWSGPKGGDIQILSPTQHILEQSAVKVSPNSGDARIYLTINLPARGRTILGQAAWEIFDSVLPDLVQNALLDYNVHELSAHVACFEDQIWLQSQLSANGLVAFVRNGAILPRVSGVDDGPISLSEGPIAFRSPPSLERSFTLPKSGVTVSGMGIPRGVTLICGGGFHGKSTLLQAIQWGVYGAKVPGDGREFCVSDPTAMKIRAEDGRSVEAVDISAFIRNLPFGKDTTCFSTTDASGSTSQASNIVEALELGSSTLLVDEDTAAGNFMIRDTKMMKLVSSDKEPIRPFIQFVRSLHTENDVSTVMVVGGLGDYFDVADKVLLMENYVCQDATSKAKEIVEGSPPISTPSLSIGGIRPRFPVPAFFNPNGKVKTARKGLISYGETELDLSLVEQLASTCQTTSIHLWLQKLSSLNLGHLTLAEQLRAINKIVNDQGLDSLAPGQYHGGHSRPRLLEVGAACNRLRRSGVMKQK